MAVLTRDVIRDTNDRKLEEVDVPAWGGSIYFGSLRLTDRNRLLARWAKLDMDADVGEQVEVQLDLLIAVACDESGEPLFGPEDREWLAERDGGVMWDLAQRAMAFLGFTTDAHEDAVKNSESTPTDVTSSALLESLG